MFARCSLTKNKFANSNYDLYLCISIVTAILGCKISYIMVNCFLMSGAMVSVMLPIRILLSTLHSINLWTCLLSSVFAWGQAKSNLGGVDTPNLHHHSIS